MLYFLITNKPILNSSMLAAGIVQDRFVGEAVEGEGGEEETTGGYFYCYCGDEPHTEPGAEPGWTKVLSRRDRRQKKETDGQR